MLEVHDLSVRLGGREVLHGVSLSVPSGQVLALIGPNGAGKTTLLRAVSGVLPYQAGSVTIRGHDLPSLSPRQRAACLAVVPQARDLPGAFTVAQTVLLGRTPYINWLGQARPADLERARWAMERTHIEPLAQRRMDTLSGGEQQRVLLARALAQETPILLLDEPTTHLDLQHQSLLLNLVQELAADHQLAVLMALHDLNLAALYARQVALLMQGRLQVSGAPAEVLTAANLEAAFQVPVKVVTHPEYGTPLILPDGRREQV